MDGDRPRTNLGKNPVKICSIRRVSLSLEADGLQYFGTLAQIWWLRAKSETKNWNRGKPRCVCLADDQPIPVVGGLNSDPISRRWGFPVGPPNGRPHWHVTAPRRSRSRRQKKRCLCTCLAFWGLMDRAKIWTASNIWRGLNGGPRRLADLKEPSMVIVEFPPCRNSYR